MWATIPHLSRQDNLSRHCSPQPQLVTVTKHRTARNRGMRLRYSDDPGPGHWRLVSHVVIIVSVILPPSLYCLWHCRGLVTTSVTIHLGNTGLSKNCSSCSLPLGAQLTPAQAGTRAIKLRSAESGMLRSWETTGEKTLCHLEEDSM